MAVALYSIIPQEHLNEVLQTLQDFIGLPIQVLDQNGDILCRFGRRPRYCSLLNQRVFDNYQCSRLLLKAGQYAQLLGEAYIFSCDANINNIAFPLIDRNRLLGTIIVGPFLMDTPDSTILSSFAGKYHLSPELLLDLYDELMEFQVIPPDRVNHLKKLLDYLLTPLLPEERHNLLQTKMRLSQQSKINEAIQVFKEQGTSSSQQFLYEKERELLIKARTGNVPETKALLNELLGYVFFNEGGTLETVRIHAIELTTLLSRVAMDSGAKADYIYGLNSQYLSLISGNKSMEELCYLLQDVVESFMDTTFNGEEYINHYIRDAVTYIAEHYYEKLNISQVAAQVGLSEGHFSRVFKKYTGMPFREYLCRIRVEESKHLLRATDYSLSDIAIAVGFPDQSYYSKIFKRIVGISPGQFR